MEKNEESKNNSQHGLANKISEVAIKVLVWAANFIYFFIKLMPVKNKVTFISRQQNTIPLDFSLIIHSLPKFDNPQVETVVLCKTLGYGFWDKVRYVPHIVHQMFHIATSRVVVLDSYCIPVSILHQRKSLTVIQLWHGLGSFKKFAYSIIDKPEFKTTHVPTESKTLARLMHLHENYDVITASNPASALHFAEAFNYDPKTVQVIPLPRVDVLTDDSKMENIRVRILKNHPELSEKKTILYAPTFRRGNTESKHIQHLIDSVDYSRFNLILKMHSVSSIHFNDKRLSIVDDFTAMELLAVADYVVTDYSAIVYEAYLTGTPVFFYQFDRSQYMHNRGVYTPISQFPSQCFTEPKQLMEAIDENRFSEEQIRTFINDQVTYKHGNTDRLTRIIMGNLK